MKKLILSVLSIFIITLFFIGITYAETSSGGAGSGGSGAVPSSGGGSGGSTGGAVNTGGSSGGSTSGGSTSGEGGSSSTPDTVDFDVSFTSPSENTIFMNDFNDVRVKVASTVLTFCTFDVQVCNSDNTCYDINYKKCPSCDTGYDQIYFSSMWADYDAVAGWNYEITATCRNKDNNEKSATISFEVDGDSTSDSTPPSITIESPTEGVKHPSTANLEFEVDELSHCEYTLASSTSSDLGGSGSAGHISIPNYINNYDNYLGVVEDRTYTLTLECEDLNGNTASKIVTFESVAVGGVSSGGGQSGSIESDGDTQVQPSTQEQNQVETTEQEQNVIAEQAKEGVIKIMPETASDNAIEVLKAEFETVELIEPTQIGENYRYRVTAKRQAKFLGLFDVELDVEAEVDAETGEVIKTKQPWWAIFVI